MRTPFPPHLPLPLLWVGLVAVAVAAGAQIPEGLLMEESVVAPPPEAPRQLQTSSASRHDGHSMNAMDVDAEDQIIGEEEGSTCYMEIQVTRRIPGRCVSLGRTRACEAGMYILPFHHECL